MLLAGCAAAPAHPAPHVYRMILPDNSVLVLPEGLTWKDFVCTMDNTFCFGSSNMPELRRQQRGEIIMRRI